MNIIFVLATMFSILNTTATTQTLEVNITNIEAIKGYVIISLYINPKTFPKDGSQYKRVKVKVKQSSVKHTFKNLPTGYYAVGTYHDKNNDNKCNLNFIGAPTEGYGFSRNFRPKFSAPTFDDVKFNLKNKYVSTIKLIN